MSALSQNDQDERSSWYSKGYWASAKIEKIAETSQRFDATIFARMWWMYDYFVVAT